MKQELERQLRCLSELISSVSPEEYSKPLESLHGSTIGQHMRHCIEFVQCVFAGTKSGVVCYDERKRDKRIEELPVIALEAIGELILLNQEHSDCPLMLRQQYPHGTIEANTTLVREIIFNIEHIVHHQAIIKTAIRSLGIDKLAKDFGVAASTLAYNQHVHVQSATNS